MKTSALSQLYQVAKTESENAAELHAALTTLSTLFAAMIEAQPNTDHVAAAAEEAALNRAYYVLGKTQAGE